MNYFAKFAKPKENKIETENKPRKNYFAEYAAGDKERPQPKVINRPLTQTQTSEVQTKPDAFKIPMSNDMPIASALKQRYSPESIQIDPVKRDADILSQINTQTRSSAGRQGLSEEPSTGAKLGAAVMSGVNAIGRGANNFAGMVFNDLTSSGDTSLAALGQSLFKAENKPTAFGRILPNKTEQAVKSYFERVDESYSKRMNSLAQKYMTGSSAAEGYLYGAVSAFTAMIPTVATAFATGGASLASMTPFMAQAAGNYYGEAKARGMSDDEATKYGLTAGILEGLTEMIPFQYGFKLLKGGTKNIAKYGIKQAVKTYSTTALKGVVTNMLEEMTINPMLKGVESGITGEQFPLVGEGGIFDPKEAVDSAIGGASLSLLYAALGLPMFAVNTANQQTKINSIKRAGENLTEYLRTSEGQKRYQNMLAQAGELKADSEGMIESADVFTSPSVQATETTQPQPAQAVQTAEVEPSVSKISDDSNATVPTQATAQVETAPQTEQPKPKSATTSKKGSGQFVTQTVTLAKKDGIEKVQAPVYGGLAVCDDGIIHAKSGIGLLSKIQADGHTTSLYNVKALTKDLADTFDFSVSKDEVIKILPQVREWLENNDTVQRRRQAAMYVLKEHFAPDKKVTYPQFIKRINDGVYNLDEFIKDNPNTEDVLREMFPDAKHVQDNEYGLFPHSENDKTGNISSFLFSDDRVLESDSGYVGNGFMILRPKYLSKAIVKKINESENKFNHDSQVVIDKVKDKSKADDPVLFPIGYTDRNTKNVLVLTDENKNMRAVDSRAYSHLSKNGLTLKVPSLENNPFSALTINDGSEVVGVLMPIRIPADIAKDLKAKIESSDIDFKGKTPVSQTDQAGQIEQKPEATPDVKGQTKAVPKAFEGTQPGDPGYKPTPDDMLKSERGSVGVAAKDKSGTYAFEDAAIEEAHKMASGVHQRTVTQKVKSWISEAIHMATRPIRTLPVIDKISGNKGYFAEIYKDLIFLPKVKSISSDSTIWTLDGILRKLPDKEAFNVFSRKVWLDNLAEEVNLGHSLPNNFTSEWVEKELENIKEYITPEIQEALDIRAAEWEQIKREFIDAKMGLGEDVSAAFTKENYFHHQVLEYMNAKDFKGTLGTGKKLKSTPKRGYMNARSGTYEGLVNVNYLEAEYAVIAQMKYDTMISKIFKNIIDNYDISAQVKADAEKQGLDNWHEAIPEGFVAHSVKDGNVFYMSKPIGLKVVEEALTLSNLDIESIKDPQMKRVLTQIMEGLEKEKEVLAVGGKRRELVIREEIAETLDNLPSTKATNILSRGSKALLNKWKRWVLTGNPKTVLKYNIRNFTGDLDFVIAADGRALKLTPKASKELFNAFYNHKFTPELKEWYDRGGFQQLLVAQEIGEVGKMKPFGRFREKTAGEIILTPLRAYEGVTSKATNYREAVLRYAVYLDYLQQLESGKLKNYGASKPEIIDGLKDNRDKAYKLSNDALGAYDEVSEAGKVIRNHLIPFYSWMEVNFKRYIQLFKNTKTFGGGAKTVIGATAKVGTKTISLLAKVTFMTLALAAWNSLVHSDLEDDIPEDVRNRPHIILGKDKDGNVIYFSRLGALNDFLEWFGLDTAPQDIIDIINGKKTFGEKINEMVKSPVNKLAIGISPFFKTPAELLTKRKLYPDVFNPGMVNDMAQYAAQSLNLRAEYDALAGKPSRPYLDSWRQIASYKADPLESAYWDIISKKYDFLDKKGEGSNMFQRSKRSMALYNYKIALRYDDEKAKDKYYDRYMELGGTKKGMDTSLRSMHPLYGIPKKYQEEFYDSLTTKEIETLERAIFYYNEVVN